MADIVCFDNCVTELFLFARKIVLGSSFIECSREIVPRRIWILANAFDELRLYPRERTALLCVRFFPLLQCFGAIGCGKNTLEFGLRVERSLCSRYFF